MGFYEDDRIRNKNKVHNEAYAIYEGLKALGFTDADVLAHANNSLHANTDSNRNEIYKNVILIAGRKREEKGIST